ncbi:MAG: hypothetical protein JXB46_00615, partial [Candidatus Eisenbacteria bacterium]|nr:hypothetical protein [Candidatus Eisenbacteria bacterium]
MRIALATTSLNRYGGAASFQDHLAGQLRSIGHEVTQYRIGRMNDTKAEIICVDRSVIKRKDQAFVAPEELTCRWPELWDRHDVVHVTNPGCLHSGFDWDQLFGRKYGPFVITIHDPHEMEVLGPTLIKLCEMADIVTFIGARYMEAFVAHGYLDGMDTKARHIIQPYTRRVPADKAWVKERRVVCTSAWRPVKRIDLITRAAELLPMEGPEAVVPLEFWSGDGVDYVEDIVESLPGYSNCVDK